MKIWRLMNYKNLVLKILRVVISMTEQKMEILNFDNILLDEKPYGIILIYDVLYKNLIVRKPFMI